MPPKVLAKTEGAKGLLPVNAATRAAATAPKPPAPRLKLEVRRLPPGLTLEEFEGILGDEWKLGNGKVDWLEYRQGKVKLSLGKVPEQSRAYVHLVDEAAISAFEARFLAVTFQDKAGTYRNPDMKHLPPTLGFAPNQRTTINTKLRSDNRQGTIDQDPEFIAFLEAETQPIARSAAIDSVSVDSETPEKVVIKSTPLIEALREKKASKAKAVESNKSDKKDGKGHARNESKNDAAPEKPAKETKNQQQQQKLENAAKEAVKAVNKQVASKQLKDQQRPASPQQPQQKAQSQAKGKKASQAVARDAGGGKGAESTKADAGGATRRDNNTHAKPAANTATSKAVTQADAAGGKQTAPRAPRQRGNADGIKKMLQKDLAGIRPKNAPAAGASKPTVPTTSTTATSGSASSPAATPTATKEQPQKQSPKPPTAPKALAQAKQQQQPPATTVSTTKAYLKHANPSQGMTEILIQQALSQFGEVANVTIDPRKGTAIAIFKDPEGLKKAFVAKKVPVANGNVEILEWKERSAGQSGGNRTGGFRGGRGGGGARGGRSGNAGSGAAHASAASAQSAQPATQPPKAANGS